jgi:hypothetical protein
MNRNLLFAPLLLAASVAFANDQPKSESSSAVKNQAQAAESIEHDAEVQAPAQEGVKTISGMSILGNQEAPKSLIIVPWKSSVLGDSLGIPTMLDDAKQPIDKEVFMRALNYYEIRSNTKP